MPLIVSPIFDLVKRRSLYDAELLLTRNTAKVNAQDHLGRTVGHVAAATGDVAMVAMLLKNGLDITICDQSGRTVVDIVNGILNEKIKADLNAVISKHKRTSQTSTNTEETCSNTTQDIGPPTP